MVQTVVQKYLLLRNGVYHFRYAIPHDIRQISPHLPREIKRSLRTDSLSEARALVSEKLPIIQAIKNCHLSIDARIELLESLHFKNFHTQPALANAVTRRQKFTFSEAWDEFCRWKTWTDKQSKANQRLYQNLFLFIGDKNIDQITKQVLRNALISIQKLPRRNQLPYRVMPLHKLAKISVPIEDRVSTKYVKDHQKLCHDLFVNYLRDERGLISKSPTEGLRYEYRKNRFAALTDEQVRTFLSALDEKPEWFKWLFLLGIYTGARRSELIRLVKDDFKWCSVSERYYFQINFGKTRAARRQVPIGKELQRTGLIEWLDTLSSPRLFKVTPNRATDLFNSILEDKKNFYGERIVFHSLRHTFITKARSAGISDVLVQQVVGHEKNGAGQTDGYTHTFNLEDTFKVVDSVSFSSKVLL